MDQDMKYCPWCGGEKLENEGTVFIEDGPYTHNRYANEGDYGRYRCLDCQHVFGSMPEPLVCTKCGAPVGGEIGEDCDQDPENEDLFLCETCMKQGGPEE